MTNRDRLISLLGFMPATDSIDGELIDKGITGAGTYDGTNITDLKRCAINLMELLFTTPDQKNESGFDIKYDRERLFKLQYQYKVDVGDIIEKKEGVLKNKSYLW